MFLFLDLLRKGSLNSQQLKNILEISLKLSRNPVHMYRPFTRLRHRRRRHLVEESKTVLVYVLI